MSAGFGGNPGEGRTGKDAKITIDLDAIDGVVKKYKKVKKYMKSNMTIWEFLTGLPKSVSLFQVLRYCRQQQ